MMSSALEHRIPELMFTSEEHPGEAISAVKALAIASAQGQRIYQITSENVNAVLPVLNVRADVKEDIRDAVAVGKVAMVSQNQITAGNWTGVGYIITDPKTGTGAYMISGGNNGGAFEAYPSDDPVARLGFYMLIFGGILTSIGLLFFSSIMFGLLVGPFFLVGLVTYYLLEPDARFILLTIPVWAYAMGGTVSMDIAFFGLASTFGLATTVLYFLGGILFLYIFLKAQIAFNSYFNNRYYVKGKTFYLQKMVLSMST